ncbi:DUF4266 domain-containing protein [uncultured Sunxiuqinia sp.]|uniref:DUF4266 domain-containing protein n=1 Tax=uncultured Sunxiuqinia sp. TaxID=1573825 RepID=UPI0030D84F24|tara:strand:- start:7199 stop:7441 length:243 start_codon:yes stop_codon:yes gene_type:complete
MKWKLPDGRNRLNRLLLIGFAVVALSSCVAVKEYEKVYINDPNMKLSAAADQRFELNFQVYREAAAGANGGKSGGGCGCN